MRKPPSSPCRCNGARSPLRASAFLAVPRLGLAVVCLLLALLPGCGGCRKAIPTSQKQTEEEAARPKKKPKPKPDFQVVRLRLQPSDTTLKQAAVKPGHWIATDLPMKANNFDFQADLQAKAIDRAGRPIDVEHTRFHLTISRPASLPKGQAKHFETLFFVPRRTGRQDQTVWLATRVLSRTSGKEVAAAQEPTMEIPDYQYFFVVLSSTPASYGFIDKLDAVRPPVEELSEEDTILYYRVVLPKIDRRVPLPSNSLTWTSIAYLVWDDLNPNLLTTDQQDALLDWLHFGGQIIISGPNSLDALKGSFLEKYLPAEKRKSTELTQSAFDRFNEYWKAAHEERQKRPDVRRRFAYEPLTVVDERAPLGVELKLAPGARFLPGDLVCERQIGRGRIVLTAFPLADRRVRSWPGFDEFLNCWLLRRPPRQFRLGEFSGVRSAWAADFPTWEKDPRLSTTLRYFTRDIGHLTTETPGPSPFNPAVAASTASDLPPQPSTLQVAQLGGGMGSGGLESSGFDTAPQQPPASSLDPETDDPHFCGFRAGAQGGAAGWNDYSGAADAARRSLGEAAGISIPEASFVLRTLAIYLVVLVPINWAFFRLIGRVEYAWAVAPLLAIAGAAAVIRFAQLDIGFARSHTEVAVLEAFGGYRRAHLTRYTALYTSLSTGYDLKFEDTSALAQPFAVDPTFQRRETQSASEVRFRREKGVSLSGFQVASNSTDMVHSEQMYNLGGAFAFEETGGIGRLKNDSQLILRDVGVLRRTAEGTLEGAWVGELKPKSAAPLRFQRMSEQGPIRFREWKKSKITSPKAAGEADDQVRLWRLFDLAAGRLRLRPGDVRMIGHSDQPLTGFAVEPQAAQVTLRTMVLAHLKTGELAPPVPDRLGKRDIIEKPPVLRDEGGGESSSPSGDENDTSEAAGA